MKMYKNTVNGWGRGRPEVRCKDRIREYVSNTGASKQHFRELCKERDA